MRDYENIKTYQLADRLVFEIYKLTSEFPREELYGITSQIRRASVSVPSNIAEGASRQHKKDYLNFLYIARGSLSEVKYLLHLSNELNYIAGANYERVEALREETSKTLYGLIEAVSIEVK
jgi:four helix bundle protein